MKERKRLVALTLAIVFLMANCTTVFAEVTDFVTIAKDGEDMYEYDYQELRKSYINYLIGGSDNPGAALYNRYAKENLKVLYDTVNGYVDYGNVRTAYIKAIMQGIPFDMNIYTESEEAVAVDMPDRVIMVKLVDGELVEEIKYLDEEPTEPTAKLTITPDPILKNNFNLASVQANILGVENVDKYAIKYSVKDANDNKHYVTTKKASIKQTNPDLIQYIEGETELEVLIYDVGGKLIVVENLKVDIN